MLYIFLSPLVFSILLVVLVSILTHKTVSRDILFVVVACPPVFGRVPAAVGIASLVVISLLGVPAFVFAGLGGELVLGLFGVGAGSRSLLFVPLLVVVAFVFFVLAAVGGGATAAVALLALVFIVLMLSGHMMNNIIRYCSTTGYKSGHYSPYC